MSSSARIRAAGPGDLSTLLSLIRKLAEYERAPEQVRGTEALLRDGLFGPHANAEAVLAEVGSLPVGFALYFHTFSTWECRRGLWLEDLFVAPEHRRAGIGRLLLVRLAQIALERGCARFEWTALDWNKPALDFYATLGARVMHEWETLRLEGEALRALGSSG